MKPKGTVYESSKLKTHGENILLVPWFLRLVYHFTRGIGTGLIALAILGFSFSFGPVLKQEFNYELTNREAKKPAEYDFDTAQADQIVAVQKEAQGYGVNSYFSIVIPKIEAYANVVANVDAADKDEYLDALSKGVAHAKGTFFPGQNGTVFLFSHSTDSPLNFARYNAVFYLLRKLEKDDEIYVYFADTKYKYKVSEIKITDATDTSWLIPKEGSEELILMTCDPPGTTWNRLLVIAKPVKN